MRELASCRRFARADGRHVLALRGLAQVCDELFDGPPVVRVQTIALRQIPQALLGDVSHLVRLVARLDQFLAPLVRGLVDLRLPHHALDIFLVQVGRRGDGNRLRLASGLVLGAHVQDAVGVDIKVTSTCGMPRQPAGMPSG